MKGVRKEIERSDFFDLVFVLLAKRTDDGRRAAAFRQIGDCGCAAKVIGQRHDRAAMQCAEPVVELLAYREFGNDLILRNMGDLHAD